MLSRSSPPKVSRSAMTIDEFIKQVRSPLGTYTYYHNKVDPVSQTKATDAGAAIDKLIREYVGVPQVTDTYDEGTYDDGQYD